MSARAEVADNITVTGDTPVQVTFRMSMHGTQGFTDTGAAGMNGYIGVLTDGNVFNGEYAAIAFDGQTQNLRCGRSDPELHDLAAARQHLGLCPV